jgi:XRE family transcriptional regulator, regulator of sulfur utilization
VKKGSFSAAFARALRRERSAQGLSQERLAHTAGLARQYVGMIERGERRPTLEAGYALARALGVPLSNLVREAEKGAARAGS